MTSGPRRTVPHPAEPFDRRKPLPSPLPKPPSDDPEAAARVLAILESPSYRVASEDIDFLASDPVRGLRLQMDYLKPEFGLRAANVERTIVVFGSSRICEPARGASPRRSPARRAVLRARTSGEYARKPRGRRARARQQPVLRHRARVRPDRRRGERRRRRRADADRDGRRPWHHGGRQPRRVRRRGQDHRPQHQPAARAVSRTPTSRRSSASTSTILRCASSTSCSARWRSSPSRAATARSTSCSRC